MEEKSVFLKVFGEYPIIKVMDFLITFREFDYPLTEIAENSGVGWTTLHSILPRFEKLGIVKNTRNIGRARLYKLNLENPLVKEIVTLDSRLSDRYAKLEIEKKDRRGRGRASNADALITAART